MPLVIILTGIPGSGKSTVLNETVKLFPELKVINYGDIMLQEASLHKIDRDTLRKLPLPQQQKIGVEAAKRMAANLPEVVCIDTHAMFKTPIGYCPGIPEGVIRILNPNIIATIECSPSQILARRASDTSRKRDNETAEQIQYHQEINRSFLLACTAIAGAIYVPVHNEDFPEVAAKQLDTLLRSYRT